MRHFVIASIVVAAFFGEAWAFMILIGVVHGEWLPMVPTVGYESSLLVALAVTLLVAVAKFAEGMVEELIDE